MNKQSIVKRCICVAIVIVIVVSMCIPALATETQKTLKVGYIDYDGYISKKADGTFTGYGVDYLNEIAKHTGWNYEYVYGTWASLMDDLKLGKIDIISNAQYTKEREEIYDFSKHPIGIETSVVYVENEDDYYFNDFKKFNGMKIAVIAGNIQNQSLAEYAQKNNFTYTNIPCDSEDEVFEALYSGKADAAAIGSLAYRKDLKIVCNFGAEPYYFILKKGNEAILSELNRALDIIKSKNRSFEADLYQKYYGDSTVSKQVVLTRDEMEYMKNAPVLKVAIPSKIKPMAYVDEKTEELTGINCDLLQLIANASGLKFDFFELVGVEGQYTYDYFIKNNIDLISGIEVNDFNNSIDKIILTNKYFEARKSLVARQGESVSEDEHLKIAIVEESESLPYIIHKNFPNYEIVTFQTIENCLDAVKDKKADVVLYNNYLINEQLKKPKYDNLCTVPGIDIKEKIALAPVIYQTVGNSEFLSNPNLINIINKAIATISQSQIDEIIIKHTVAQKNSLSINDVFYKYRVTFIASGCFIFVCIGLFIFIIFIKQINLKKTQIANKQLGEAFAQAEQANNAKSQFLSRMSHEIRTPMNAIVGITAIAKKYSGNKEKIDEYLDKINTSSKILLNIINDVLDMSAIESDKLQIAHNPFDFKALLSAISAMYYTQCKQKDIEFEMILDDVTEEFLIGDSLRLNQILLNLISNAYKFTDKGGKIKVVIKQTVKKDKKIFIQFEVSDNGCGMSKEMQERVFKPFEQESTQTALNHGGSGLGLSITKNLVDMMKGAINLVSEKNIGTTFTVNLPFEIDPSVKALDATKFKDIKALVVDDDKNTCDYTAIVLDRIGVQYNIVNDGEEAVQTITDAYKNGTGYDICFIDWKMPGISGVEVTKKIREFYDNDTIIIIVSAYDLSEVQEEAKSAGANMFISKPLFQSTVYNLLMALSGGKYTKITADEKDYDFTGHRIILAEDNALNREIAVELLNMVGLTVDCAENGKEAVNMFENSKVGYYDLILMDIQMPILNGHEATMQIRNLNHAQASSIPIFAMTANAFTEDITTALSSGMNGHIAKPIDTEILYSTLYNCFEKTSYPININKN